MEEDKRDAAAGGSGRCGGLGSVGGTQALYIPAPSASKPDYRATDSIQLMRALARAFGSEGFDATAIVARAQRDWVLLTALGFLNPKRRRGDTEAKSVRRWLKAMEREGRLSADELGWLRLPPGGGA